MAHERDHTFTVGDVTVTRVLEWAGPFLPTRAFVAEADEDDWARAGATLPVPFWDDEGTWRCAMQSWVLRSGDLTIVVDTCYGHHATVEGYESRFVENLAAAGVDPDDVQVVVNTHLHGDHIGWNTRLLDDAWVPTFPNATYLMTQADLDFLDPERSPLRVFGDAVAPLLADFDELRRASVQPLLDAGLVVRWEGRHRIDDRVTVEPAPGHTPGSAVVRVESSGEQALFIGDVVHLPVQLAAPDANSVACFDGPTARATRRRLLDAACASDAVVVPAHFVGAGAVHVERDGDGFAIARWAPLAQI